METSTMKTRTIKTLKIFATIFSLLIATVSIYVFSRFTVDDAFITWRYGRNLIDFGVWNFNPSGLDPTQAYTNPIYAALAIIPSLMGWDVVLFFKLFSTMLLVLFVYWFGKVTRGSWIMVFLLIGLPATVVHIYGGLETFLFVFLMGALLIALHEEKNVSAIIICLLLFITRPETWLLAALLPLYLLISEKGTPGHTATFNPLKYYSEIKIQPIKAGIAAAILATALSSYLLFHYLHFGNALPNTFYIKKSGNFSPLNFIKFSFFLLPILPLLFVTKIKQILLMAGIFGAMIISYSTSNLQMDYSGRFAFHIFAPIYIYATYLASKADGKIYGPAYNGLPNKAIITHSTLAKGALLFYLAAFALISDNIRTYAATYYPRALISHAELGKTINHIAGKYGIRAYSFGDAGMAAYHSRINTLDNIGLGSSAVAKTGVNASLLENYHVDLIVFHADSKDIQLEADNQKPIYEWAIKNHFVELCDIYWRKYFTFKVYSKTPISEITELCAKSKQHNDVEDYDLLKKVVLVPPWKFWTE